MIKLGRGFLLTLFIIVPLIIFISTKERSKDVSKPTSQNSYTAGEIENYLKSEKCQHNKDYNKCLNEIAQETIKKFEFTDILNAYETLQSQNPGQSCHDAMHFLASNEYKKTKDLPRVFNQCTSVCFNACYHGAVLGYMSSSGLTGLRPEQTEQIILHACDSLFDAQKQSQSGNCVHGLGHALMLITENELPKTLKLCDVLDNKGNRENCYAGAFMENFPNSSSSDHPSKYISKNDPLYPCNILEERYLKTCYTFLTDYFNYLNKNELKKTIAMCNLVPSPYRNNCYKTIGSGLLGKTQDYNKIIEVCEQIPNGESREFCIKGVVLSFSDRYGGDTKNLYKMFDFCQLVKEQYKKACYSQIGVNLSQWVSRIEKEDICSNLKEQEKNWCLGRE